MADPHPPQPGAGVAGAETGGTVEDEAARAEQRRLELRIRAQNRALRDKEQQLLASVERLQEKEEAAARLAYLAQEESRKLAAALSDLRDAQQTLRASEEKFRAVAESAMDAIVTADAAGTVVYANRSAHLMFGYDS